MDKLHAFDNGERICFIGDSITEITYWISYIADYYSKNTDKMIEIYPCGISGGTVSSAINCFYEQTAVWKPTTAVIMLGMNDIGRSNYGGELTDEKLMRRESLLQIYEKNLTVLSRMLKEEIKVKRIIYLAPTPYDEEQICDTPNLIGCQNALRKCADIMQNIAKNFECEYFDFGGIIYDLIHESYLMKSKNKIINADRVHPNNLGFSVMARVFLSAQGFAEMSVNAEQICDGSAELHLSDKGENFQMIARTVQSRWTAEHLVASTSPDQSTEGKIKYMDKYLTNPDAYQDFYVQLARRYAKLVADENDNRKMLVNTIKDLFER